MFRVARSYPRIAQTYRGCHTTSSTKNSLEEEVKKTQDMIKKFHEEYKEDAKDNAISGLFMYGSLALLIFALTGQR